ncbi:MULTISPECIES: DUF6507 family protein [unclassified Streptomyces]|uniref:DUF6507 family protein n=1 Tax=Streptomycetaceae TaxID=2062 RepID=UPI002E788974|nr:MULTISPECIES: DUF6507 family protein [unclassified Streptomyces]MED7947981.1 DUF6507 family protein [Streptomyces sp. BE303]MEE1822905.1 DUF6507 family protein [Streptomyces sp. BE20]
MVAWDIKPQGVQGQLKTVGGHAGDLETALNTLMTNLSQAAQNAGTAVPGSQSETRLQGPVPVGAPPLSQKAMGPVAAALSQYLEGRKAELKSMSERIEACLRGAVKATNEYLEGDLTAAKQAQDAARAINLEALRDQPGGKK